jgi:hypothetical protein
MKYLRYFALATLLMLPLAYSQAEVRFSIGFGPGYVAGPPSCAYGYYSDYPYTCAPYGYYGPSYFVNGIFIGAGPWYHGYSRSYYANPYYGRSYYGPSYYGRSYYSRSYNDRRYNDRRYEDRRYEDRGWNQRRDYNGRDRDRDFQGNGFRGGDYRGGRR